MSCWSRARRPLEAWIAWALTDILDHDGEYYRDAFGNMVEGKRPAPKTGGYYVDAGGYIVELASGETAPTLSGNGLAEWINNQDIASDPELRAALGEDNLFFEERIQIGCADVLLTGRLESKGWLVFSHSDDTDIKDLKFG